MIVRGHSSGGFLQIKPLWKDSGVYRKMEFKVLEDYEDYLLHHDS